MKKVYIALAIAFVVCIGSYFVLTNEKYDESIHDAYIQDMVDRYPYKQFFKPDPSNKYGYDISVYKSDDKEELPHNVSSKKYYSYYIFINATPEFDSFSNSQEFDYMDGLTNVFRDKTVGEDTAFAGHYKKVILSYDGTINMGEFGDTHVSDKLDMNVNGFPKLLDGSTREEYTILFYDDNGKAVRSGENGRR